ncbi:MAG: acyl-CoA thioesterase [Bacteroidota bacterium]|nr:acyl-CoA thioesterase [Bacteroidota bacterium]
MNTKTVKDSQVEMIELVLPNDTNVHGNLLGGRLMHWIDIAAALAASRHCNNVAVTAAVDNLNFHHAIHLGNIVRLKASVNRAFNTSMEVGVKVEVEDIKTGVISHSNSAYLTFVNIDNVTKKPEKVPVIIPETDEEKRRFEHALKRREQRLSEYHGIIQTK